VCVLKQPDEPGLSIARVVHNKGLGAAYRPCAWHSGGNKK
jgi:hypothetical protein